MKAHVFQLESGHWIFPLLALLLKAVWSVLPGILSFGMSLGRTPQRPAGAENITVCVRSDVPENWSHVHLAFSVRWFSGKFTIRLM